MNVRRVTFLVVIAWSLPVCADWQPAQGRLMTRWAKEVSPDNVHPEYPRPQMVRDQWASLNGLWQYAITPTQASGGGEAAEYAHAPKDWQGEILVPFPVESALSGVMKTVGEDNRLWYRRTFTIPNNWSGKRVLLHFGAVDWDAAVWVNGKEAGRHRGGYDPFSFDVTDALKPGAENELVVSVWDPSDKGFQPRGKQVDRPRGIWYTPVTGIWQTVWLEPVARTYVASLSIVPDLAGGMVRMIVNRAGEDRPLPAVVTVRSVSAGEVSHAFDDRKTTASVRPGETAVITLPEVHGWSPAEPWLYQFSVTLMDGTDRAFDTLRGYFALRDIAVTKDAAGVNRLFLNGEPLFQYGPLDQGWWPDGLYTAPTDEALRYDIEMTKKLGFNMCRKHVKVEPARWYYWCDKLGLMVWQDMPNGDRHIRERDPDITRTAESEENYRREWQAIMGALRNVPSIVAWVPFNEGWGQFKTNEILEWTKQLDPTRLVDGPSGWTDRGGGDLHDMHRYPGPAMFPVSEQRASVLGEFGGLGLPVEGHTWLDKDNWGYRNYTNKEELQRAYEQIVGQLPWLIGDGLAAAIYTQTTDVEIEVNGLMTYDRSVLKYDADRLAKLHARLYGRPPTVTPVIPTAEAGPVAWRYTTDKPADGWERPGFDDSSWQSGPAGFGEPSTPGSVVRTQWKTNDIWLRRTFALEGPGDAYPGLHLRLHHDEDTEVYLNGVLAAKVPGYVTQYVFVPLDDAARQALRRGENTLAVHCRQTGGGQYVDVGLVEAKYGE